MFDSNVFDKLATDDCTRSLVRAACRNNLIRIVVSPVVVKELEESPFCKIPDFIPIDVIADTVFVPGLAVAGLAMPGSGKVFSKHLGKSKKGADAVIAD